jgi:hypothetical protein
MGIISNSSIGGSLVDPAVKGDLTTFSNAIVNLGISPALTGKVLTQLITASTGLEWKSPVGNKGGLLSNDGTNTKELPVGFAGQVLTANDSATSGVGLQWDNPNKELQLKGDLLSFTGSALKGLDVGTDGKVLTADSTGTSGVGIEWKPTVAVKGGLISNNGTIGKELPVGTVGQLLTANPTATSGVAMEWDDNKVNLLTQKADLLSAVAGTVTKLAGSTGSDGQVLTKKLSETVGMEWATPAVAVSAKSIMGIARTTIFDNPSLTTKVATQTIPMSGNDSNSLAFYNTTPASAEWIAPIDGKFDDWTMELESVVVGGTDFFDIEIQIGTATPINLITGIFNAQTGGVSGAISVPFNNSDLIKILVTPSGVLDPIAVLKIRSFNWSFTAT